MGLDCVHVLNPIFPHECHFLGLLLRCVLCCCVVVCLSPSRLVFRLPSPILFAPLLSAASMPRASARNREPDVSQLIQYLHAGRWRKATNWVNKYTSAVSTFKSRAGWSVLHVACHLNAPETVIAALLKANPRSATLEDHRGFTPLHLASCSSIHGVIDQLLRAEPHLVHSKGFDNRYTPLQLLCMKYHTKLTDTIGRSLVHKSHLEGTVMLLMRKAEVLIKASYYGVAIEGMVRCDPLIGLRTNWRDTECMCSLIEEMSARPLKSKRRTLVAALVNPGSRRKTPLFSGRLTRSNRYVEGTKFRMVHACAGIKDCPPVLMRFALKVYPNQVTEPDEDGNLPLHIAAACIYVVSKDPDYNSVASCLNEAGLAAFDDHGTGPELWQGAESVSRSSSSPRIQTNSQAMQRSAIEMLLAACPSTAKVYNAQQKLPMHIALESGRSWDDGVAQLYQANTGATSRCEARIVEHLLNRCDDGNNKKIGDVSSSGKNTDLDLFPFMYAACHGASLSSIYSLFRACPEISRFSNLGPNNAAVAPAESREPDYEDDADCIEINQNMFDDVSDSPQAAAVVSWSPLMSPPREDTAPINNFTVDLLPKERHTTSHSGCATIALLRAVSFEDDDHPSDQKKRKSDDTPMHKRKRNRKHG
jgi:ankyrin repeat protein